MIFLPNGDIALHQSWLDGANRCPERGRLDIVRPELREGNDAAHCGTGTHAMIEAHIVSLVTGEPMPDDLIEVGANAIHEKIALEGCNYVKFKDFHDMLLMSIKCYEAWVRDILPVLHERNWIEGALTEHFFKVPLFTLGDGRTVFIEGTVDLAPRDNHLVDWKTSGRTYDLRKKQRYEIQPTIYTLAAVLGGVPNDVTYGFPMNFTYGVVVRAKEPYGQLVTVRRTQAHADFAVQRIKGWVDLALNFTLERPWPRNDGEGNFLCSSTWCSFWNICKGSNAIDDSTPVQLTIKDSE